MLQIIFFGNKIDEVISKHEKYITNYVVILFFGNFSIATGAHLHAQTVRHFIFYYQ